MDEGFKIYGVCLERLRHQINMALARLNGGRPPGGGRILLEGYQTGDIDDIVDILEIYDMGDRTAEALREKLDELAESVSMLARQRVAFDFSDEGVLCLYMLNDG